MTLGSQIKKLRKEKKMTQKNLACKAKISVSYLTDIERDLYVPSLKMIVRIAFALGIDMKNLNGE